MDNVLYLTLTMGLCVEHTSIYDHQNTAILTEKDSKYGVDHSLIFLPCRDMPITPLTHSLTPSHHVIMDGKEMSGTEKNCMAKNVMMKNST